MQGLEIGKSRKITVRNDGKVNSFDVGFLLIQQVEKKHRIIKKLSDYFTDKRDLEKITHSLAALLKRGSKINQLGTFCLIYYRREQKFFKIFMQFYVGEK